MTFEALLYPARFKVYNVFLPVNVSKLFLKFPSRSLLVNYSPKHGIYWVRKMNILLFSVIALEKSNQIKIISLQM